MEKQSQWETKALFSKFSLENRVAVITGGGSGIGKGISLGFAGMGANIVIAEWLADKGKVAAEEIRALGRKALPIVVDATHEGQVKSMVEKVMSEFGRIDILVNNVGGTRGLGRVPIMDMDEDLWNTMIKANMNSTFLCSKMVSKVMVSQKSGNIINIVSFAGIRPYPAQLPYGAAKAGLINFTQSLAVQLAPYKIRVNAIAPGITATPAAMYMGDLVERVKKNGILFDRPAHVEDMAYAAIFLASDASEYITGHILPVAGGPYGGSFMLAEAEADWKRK